MIKVFIAFSFFLLVHFFFLIFRSDLKLIVFLPTSALDSHTDQLTNTRWENRAM